MNIIIKINEIINSIVWGIPTIILIAFVGIFFTIRLKGVQFTKFGTSFKTTIGGLFKRAKDEDNKGKKLTSLQAAMTSISAVIGSGNIAGVATAIVCGGPGALFWMIIAALLGMATKYAEIILGIIYRKINNDGSIDGGAMYYLSAAGHSKWVGRVFAFFVIPFAFIISAVVDTNTISGALESQFSIDPIITGIILAIVCGIIILGGLKRVGQVCEWVAPIMGGTYIIAGLLVIILNIQQLPNALSQIFIGAFNPSAITGGAIGSFFICLRYGMARGAFSNEAGLGTAAMIHCGADVKHPVEQGMWGPVEVFMDTIVVCTITALTIIMSGLWTEFDGAVLTMKSFEKLLPGSIGTYICLSAIILFGFSSLISCYTYAQRAASYLFGPKSAVFVKILWTIFIFIGSLTTLGFAWDLADTFNGLMIIPNLIGLLILSKQIVKSHNEYWANHKKKKREKNIKEIN